MDFIFIVREKKVENNTETKIKKEWYSGYIGFLNVTQQNETHNMLHIYDNSLNKYLNTKYMRRLSKSDKIEVNLVNEENKICFAKIDFYQNGNIKDFYLPKEFNINNFEYINNTAKLLISKISKSLFNKTINETLNELLKSNEIQDNNSIINDIDKEINNTSINDHFNTLRLLSNQKYQIKINKSISNRKKRKLSDENSNNNTIKYSTETEDIEIEEYLKDPLSKSINLECREVNQINKTIQAESNITNNYSNLTEFSTKTIENDKAKMEGATMNTTVYSFIDKQGFLESVIEESISIMKTLKESEEEDEETQNLNSEVYNEDNEINMEDIKNPNESEYYKNNSFSNINITYISLNMINCTDYYTDDNINKKLYKYFDSFNYIKFNSSEYNNETSFEFNSNNINNLRNLEEKNSYYGLKTFKYVKQLYKQNIIGIKMEGQIFTEITPSSGKTTSYFVLVFGKINSKIKLSDQYSNLNILLEKKNQLGYKLLSLLRKSNIDLEERNKKYLDVIFEFEKNITKLFLDTYDYSSIFGDSLNNMYHQLQNFSGEFFYELIRLINNVYDNFTIILNNVELNKYDEFLRIRIIIKEEYINYIYHMVDLLEIFENNTLTFLINIENELNNINDFQVDILYDIIDQLYESKSIFKQFNKNLFKSIEKGILTLKYDIKDYIDIIIGELLYITDFLSVNINKNEMIVKAIDINTRNDVTSKLKNFKNMVIYMMDLLIENINNDYENEMDLNYNKSIKYYSYFKAQKFIENTEEKSDKVISDIKGNINNFEKYESYSNNLDKINAINNKTIIESLNDIQNKIINYILNIKQEYTNQTSNIIKNENKLFNISKKIIMQTNEEINSVNSLIAEYSKQYREKNMYNMHYNLYYFKKAFMDKQMEQLLDEFYLLLNRTIKTHFKIIIDYNFNLGNQVFNEENDCFNSYERSLTRRHFMCSGFISRYHEYKANIKLNLKNFFF